MTGPQQRRRGQAAVRAARAPAPVPLRHRLPASGAAYAFSRAADGSMSTRVGTADPRPARARLAAMVGVAPTDVAWMAQVHGADVAVLDRPADPPPRCDGVVTTAPGTGVAVLVADCVPVLLAGPGGVAAAHAGRDGLVAGVVGATAAQLCAASGDVPARLEAVVGPAIGPCCYEVPEAMAADVEAAVPGTRATTTWGTPSLDLVAGVLDQLDAAGVAWVGRAGGCTRCDGATWFSHRATTGAEGRAPGRQAGIVALQGGAA